jgi:hypothetical protein
MAEETVCAVAVMLRRPQRWSMAAALVGLAALLIYGSLLIHSSPASALVQRGHVFGGSFGEGFDGADKLAKPSGVAVDEASSGEAAGDVYVLDSANNRVVRFGPAPEHRFIEAWGYGVAKGAEVYETCNGGCRPGIAGFKKGEFDDPVAIAIDNASGSPSRGDVYVVANRTWKKAVIDKFSPKGVLVGRLVSKIEEKEEVEGMIDGVAVDQSGTVWVEREDEEEEFALQRFDDQTPNRPLEEVSELEIENLEGPRPGRPGFAVDSKGDIYTTYEPNGTDSEQREEEAEEIKEREKERKQNHEELKNEHPQEPCERNACLVAKLALAPGLRGLEAEPLIYELDGENSTGVAVDLSTGTQSSNDVYLDNGTSIAAFTSTGSLIQRFGSGQLGGGAGLAVDASTGEVLVADASAGRIDVFTPAPPGPPVVEKASVAAAHVSSSAAELRATIDPGGSGTHYRFQYGTATCASQPTACAEFPAPPAPGSYLGQGFGDQVAAVDVAGLAPSTTYHFRAIAENRFAEGSGSVISEERTFTTQSAAGEAVLPDGRAWELVSPPDKHGASVEPIAREGGLVQAASDGRSITYLAAAPIGENEPEGNRAPERSQILSSRTSDGWSSRDIATPNTTAQGIRGGLTREYEIFSADLSQGLLESPGEAPPYLPEKTIYLRNDLACVATPASCYEPLVTAVDDTAGGHFASRVAVAGATPDLSHVVLQAGVPLTKGASGTGLYEWAAGKPAAEALRLVSVLPGGVQSSESVSLGGGTVREMASTAISENGARVVWRTGGNGVGHLYLREVEKEQTVEVDEANSGVPAPKLVSKPVFQTASSDGSKVFFTDAQRLTEDSTAPETPSSAPPQDLYVFEPERPAGERLTDLTSDLNSGEGAAIQGSVLAAGEGGSLVYFVANGVLAEAAQPGNCRFDAPSGAGCNLYVVHRGGEGWERPRFIARLSGEDAPDWGRPEPGSNYELKTMTSRVSPNGEYLAFMSNRSLKGYNNVDVKSGVADEEVYLYRYDGGAGSLVCASCNPSGAQPAGVYDTEESGEGIGLLVDRPQIWGTQYAGVDHWLAASVPGWTPVGLLESFYQSRYLTNEGRLFFNSADSLVPRDVNGKEDVYEYERPGVGGCRTANAEGGCVALVSSGESEQESAFLDASESGNDVFFLTSAKLSPLEPETTFDVYDARVCEAPGAEPCASSEPLPPTPCASEVECRPAPSPQPTHGAPASSTVSGSGNLAVGHGEVLASKNKQRPQAKAPTRAKRLARALKACKKAKPKSRRVACEKRARKRYRAKVARAKGHRAKRARAGLGSAGGHGSSAGSSLRSSGRSSSWPQRKGRR